METIELKISRIGNSRGVRLPATLLKRYHIKNSVLVEISPDALILRPKLTGKLSWKETFAEMALEKESWDDFDSITSDGLSHL